ncbi:MAG TPA: peptidyl-prolyl cis-trans isomerase [Allosphingosinicella sp.]|jgi:peptidyl-prolyl cis-trans isomerase D
MKTFRSKLTQWLMLAFLVLAVGAIVITGFGTDGMGGLPGGGSAGPRGGETLVEVGGEELKSAELDAVLERRLREIQQQNPDVTMGQLLAAGAYEAALDQLITRRALWEYGRSKGLVVSDAMIDRVLVAIPAFHNLAGQFDDTVFRQRIGELGLTEPEIRREVAYDLMERQLQEPVARNVAPPEPITLQYASLLLERRRGIIGVVPNEAVSAGINPTDAQIAAHYQANRARYTVPERRVLRYALINREQAAAGARATDQEIAAYYQQNQARYAGTETRNLQQIILPTEAEARTFVQRAGGGANFVAAAQQAGRSPADVNLGAQSREQFTNIANAQIAGQVFSAAQGAMIGPVRSPLGFHVIRVEAINRAAARPLEAVRGEIVAAVEQRKGEEAMANAIGRIEERIAGGESFEEVARAERLAVIETPPVTAAGTAPGVQWQAPAEIPAIVRGAFMIDPEDTEPTVETLTPNQRYALVSLARVVPTAVPPLAQIRDRVRTDVIQQQASQRARTVADRIVAAINRGIPPARAFAEAGVRLPAPQPVDQKRIDILRRGGDVPPPLAALFSLPQGRARTVGAPAGVFVVTVTERIAGQASCPTGQAAAAAASTEGCQAIQGARADLQAQMGGEIGEQLARAARNSIEIRRNEEAIRRARQALLTR